MNDFEDLNFDASQIEPDAGFTPIPAGDYDVMISSAEKRQTKSGTGSYLKIELVILAGQYQNRRHFENFNLWNPNAQTVSIAKAQFSAFCRAVGIMTPKNSSEFVGKTLTVRLKVQPRKDQPGEYQNRVSEWKPRSVAASQSTQPVAAGAGGGW